MTDGSVAEAPRPTSMPSSFRYGLRSETVRVGVSAEACGAGPSVGTRGFDVQAQTRVRQPAGAHTEEAPGLARLVGEQLDLRRQVEDLGEPLARFGRSVHDDEAALDTLGLELRPVVPHLLRVLDHVEVGWVRAEDDERRHRRREQLAQVDLFAVRDAREDAAGEQLPRRRHDSR